MALIGKRIYIGNSEKTPAGGFFTARQTPITNHLSKVTDKSINVDRLTGDGVYEAGEFAVKITSYESRSKLKATTLQLFASLRIAATATKFQSPTIQMPLSTYMEMRGLRDRKSTREQVRADLELLSHYQISGTTKENGKNKKYGFINVADSGEIDARGNIIFTFGSTFFDMLKNGSEAPYPSQALTINSKKNPHSLFLLDKLNEHKFMNTGKPNENRISVAALLEALPDIATIDEVRQSGNHISQLIIEPFERDMDELSDTLTWHYCYSNGAIIPEEELAINDYNEFASRLVSVTWRNYPDQTERMERKAQRKKAATKKKKPAPPH